MEYSKNASLHYLRVSDDEVVVKGSHLEGFSLLVTDDKNAGLAGRVIDALDSQSTVEGIRDLLPEGLDVGVDEIATFLEELAAAGAVLRHGDRPNNIPEWLAFLRFGHADASAQRHSLTVAGSDVAGDAVEMFGSLGFEAKHVREWTDLQLDEFVVPDVSKEVAERIDAGETGGVVTQDELPDDDAPRLVVLAEGAPLSDLYRLNERAVAAGVPVLYAQVAGSDFAIGPQVVPGATACFWEFERQRSRSLFSYSEYAVLAAAGGHVPTPAITKKAAAAAILPYLVELSLLGRSMLAGNVIRGRATTAETSKHAIMRLPRCPTCLAQRPILRNLLF